MKPILPAEFWWHLIAVLLVAEVATAVVVLR